MAEESQACQGLKVLTQAGSREISVGTAGKNEVTGAQGLAQGQLLIPDSNSGREKVKRLCCVTEGRQRPESTGGETRVSNIVLSPRQRPNSRPKSVGIEMAGTLPLKSDIINKNSHKTKKEEEREGGGEGGQEGD
jgi:hypothetical protein